VPRIVRRASSATPVPVVNETFFLLLSGLRFSFKGSSFFVWARQYWYSVDVALAAFGGRLTFPFREVFVPLLSQWTDSGRDGDFDF
jgi:hypothetical protein